MSVEEDLGGRRGKQTKQRQGGVDPAIRFKPHPPIDWRATKIDGGSGRRRIRCGACRLTRDGTEGGRSPEGNDSLARGGGEDEIPEARRGEAKARGGAWVVV